MVGSIAFQAAELVISSTSLVIHNLPLVYGNVEALRCGVHGRCCRACSAGKNAIRELSYYASACRFTLAVSRVQLHMRSVSKLMGEFAGAGSVDPQLLRSAAVTWEQQRRPVSKLRISTVVELWSCGTPQFRNSATERPRKR